VRKKSGDGRSWKETDVRTESLDVGTDGIQLLAASFEAFGSLCGDEEVVGRVCCTSGGMSGIVGRERGGEGRVRRVEVDRVGRLLHVVKGQCAVQKGTWARVQPVRTGCFVGVHSLLHV